MGRARIDVQRVDEKRLRLNQETPDTDCRGLWYRVFFFVWRTIVFVYSNQF